MKNTELEHTAWNQPERLPPVGCPLLIKMPYDRVEKATRTGHLENRSQEMEYLLESGETVRGRFLWTYP